MDSNATLKWLFLDLNSYFASVEQQERPELRGRPVIVVPMMSDYTCAIAASYEAKAYGVITGTPVGEAKKMCPGLRCVLARHDVYVDYHNRIYEEVLKHTPINKAWSIDEFSSRLPPDKRTAKEAADVARKIKEGIWKNIGPAINCSIGIAPNSLLGKIAADMQKPDGFVILKPEELREKLCTLKLTDIPGIGRNMEARLKRAGVHSINDLWNTSPKQARKIWGSVQGERFWYWLHGYDFENPEQGNVMIGHSRVLDPELRRPDKARLMARRLLVKATYRLRRKGFFASHLRLGVRTTDDFKFAREIKMPHARDPFTFLQALDDLWAELALALPPTSGVRFKKVSVILSGLKTANEITGDLLATATPESIRQTKRRESLAGALDALQAKYRKETVWLGVTPKTSAGHVGTKIAFSRVPDREEFWN